VIAIKISADRQAATVR